MRRAETLLATVLLLFAPAVLAAQGGSIRGRVADPAGAALARAQVTVEGTGQRATRDRKSTRLNSSHQSTSRMPSSA